MVGFRHWLCAPGMPRFQHPLTAVAPWCVESVQVELVPWLCCMAPAIALFATYFTAGTLRMRDFSGRHRKEIKGDQVTKHCIFYVLLSTQALWLQDFFAKL